MTFSSSAGLCAEFSKDDAQDCEKDLALNGRIDFSKITIFCMKSWNFKIKYFIKIKKRINIIEEVNRQDQEISKSFSKDFAAYKTNPESGVFDLATAPSTEFLSVKYLWFSQYSYMNIIYLLLQNIYRSFFKNHQ